MNAINKNCLGGIPFNLLTKGVVQAINSANYTGNNGAIARANRLSRDHFSGEKHPDLCVIGMQMNTYYFAAEFFLSKGWLFYPQAFMCLYHAKNLADKYINILLRSSSKVLSHIKHEYPVFLYQCQAIYCAWAILKKKFGFNVEFEISRCEALYGNIVSNMENNDMLLTALSTATALNFPIKATRKMYISKYSIIRAIEFLEGKVSRTEYETQVLSFLFRSLGRYKEAKEVAKEAGLTDQLVKAEAGI